MKIPLTEFITLYRFSTARIIRALRQIQHVLKRRNDKSLSFIAEHVAKALKHARLVRELERRFNVSRAGPSGNARLAEIDVLLDRALTALRDAAQAHASGGGDEKDTVPALARQLIADCFPRGVQAVTQVSFVEELSLVEGMLAIIKAKHTEMIEKLGLGRLIARITKLADEYRREQEVIAGPFVDYATVRAGRDRAQELLMEVVALVLGRFAFATPEHDDARVALLGPVRVHNAAIGEARRARRSGEVVDLGGEEPEEPEAPEEPEEEPEEEPSEGEEESTLEPAPVE